MSDDKKLAIILIVGCVVLGQLGFLSLIPQPQPGPSSGSSHPFECSKDSRRGSVVLSTIGEEVETVRYAGTGLFVDCFEFVVASAVCDGEAVAGGGGAMVNVSGFLRADGGVVQPLSSDMLGASVLSLAYYYDRPRKVGLVFALRGLGSLSGSCSVNVSYTFSIYTSRDAAVSPGAPALAAPFVTGLTPYVLMTGTATAVRLSLTLGDPSPPSSSLRHTIVAVPFSYGKCHPLPTASDQQTVGTISYGTSVEGDWGSRVLPMSWVATFASPGLHILCLQPTQGNTYLYAGVVDVYPTNPAYFMNPDVMNGDDLKLNEIHTLTIHGVGLDGRSGRDQAKLVSATSSSCAQGVPAGGVPLQTSFGESFVTDKVSWNIVLTIQGSFALCYYRAAAGRWVRVTPFRRKSIDSRKLMPVTEWVGALPPRGDSPTLSLSLSVSLASPSVQGMEQGLSRSLSTTEEPSLTPTLNVTLSINESVTKSLNVLLTATPSRTQTLSQRMSPSQHLTASHTLCDTQKAREDCLLIPAPLPLKSGGTSSLRMVLTVTYAGALPKSWVADLARLLCVDASKIAVFEYAESSSGSWEVLVGIQCVLTDSCSTSLVISTVNCAVNAVSPALEELRQALRNETGITGCTVRDSSISTSNTTYHAAPSSNTAVLSPAEVAIVSSTAAVVAGGIVAAIVFAIVVWRRRQIAERMRALHVRFFHPAEMFTDGSVRPAHADVDSDFHEGGAATSTVNGVVLEMHEERHSPDQKNGKKECPTNLKSKEDGASSCTGDVQHCPFDAAHHWEEHHGGRVAMREEFDERAVRSTGTTAATTAAAIDCAASASRRRPSHPHEVDMEEVLELDRVNVGASVSSLNSTVMTQHEVEWSPVNGSRRASMKRL